MDHLLFKVSRLDELIQGKKYLTMKYSGTYYIGIFTGYTMNGANFNAKVIGKYITTIRHIRFYDETREYYYVDFQKEKIQNDMEMRAVNSMLRIITGDNTFIY